MSVFSGYSTAELLSFRSSPFRAPPRMSTSALLDLPHRPHADLHALRRQICSCQDTVLRFSNYRKGRHQLLTAASPHDASGDNLTHVPSNHATSLLKKNSCLVKYLRYGRTVAFFNLYPSSQRALEINHLLWTTAQTGEYDPLRGNLLLKNNLFTVALPAKLHHFLATTSEHDVKLCLLELLALIAEDEDDEGFALMESELAESLWIDLMEYMSDNNSRLVRINRATERGIQLMAHVETLLNLCSLSPWKIEVYTAYVTPQDMAAALLSTTTSYKPHAEYLSDTRPAHRRPLVRSAARRPVSMPLPAIQRAHARVHVTNRTAAFWSLFQDWVHYRAALIDAPGVTPKRIAVALLHSIANGTQKSAWHRADAVLNIASDEQTLFASLPTDVVANVLYPYILLLGSSAGHES